MDSSRSPSVEGGLDAGGEGDVGDVVPAPNRSRCGVHVVDQAVQVDLRDVLENDDVATQLPVAEAAGGGEDGAHDASLPPCDRHHGAALPSVEECCIVRAVHNRVRQFTALVQLWLEDPRTFNFVGEWVGPSHPEPAAAAFRAQRDDEEMLLQAIREELQRTLADPTVPKEEKVDKMKAMSDRQKMIFVRRAERLEQSRLQLREHHEKAFRTMNERSIEDDADENNLVVGAAALAHSCVAHLGKLFVFLRAAVQGNTLPTGSDCSAIFPGGERQRTVYGLTNGLHGDLDTVVFPRDFGELRTIVKGGELPDLYRIKYTTPWNFGTDELAKLRDKFLKQYAAEEFRKVQAMAKKKKDETVAALDKELAKIRSAAVQQHQLEASLATSQRRATSAGGTPADATTPLATPPPPPPLVPSSSAIAPPIPANVGAPKAAAPAVASGDSAGAGTVPPVVAPTLSRPTSTSGKPPMSPAVTSASHLYPQLAQTEGSTGDRSQQPPLAGPSSAMSSLTATVPSAGSAGALKGPQSTLPPLPNSNSNDDTRPESQSSSARDSIATTVDDSSRMLKTVVGSAISPVDGPLDAPRRQSMPQFTEPRREPRSISLGSLSDDVEGSAITAWQEERPSHHRSGSIASQPNASGTVGEELFSVDHQGNTSSTSAAQQQSTAAAAASLNRKPLQRGEPPSAGPAMLRGGSVRGGKAASPSATAAASPLAFEGAPKQYHGNMYAQLRNAVQRDRQQQQQQQQQQQLHVGGGGARGGMGRVQQPSPQSPQPAAVASSDVVSDGSDGVVASKDVSRMAATATLSHAHEQLHTVSDAFTEQQHQKRRGGSRRLLSSSLRGTVASAPTSLTSDLMYDEYVEALPGGDNAGRRVFGDRGGKKLYTANTHRNLDGRMDVEVIPTEDGPSLPNEGDAQQPSKTVGKHNPRPQPNAPSASVPRSAKLQPAGSTSLRGGAVASLASELAGGGALASLAAKVKHQRELITDDMPRPSAAASPHVLQPVARHRGETSTPTQSASPSPPPPAAELDLRLLMPRSHASSQHVASAGGGTDDGLAAHAVATSAAEQLMVEAMLQGRLQRNQLQLLRAGGSGMPPDAQSGHPAAVDALHTTAVENEGARGHDASQDANVPNATVTDVPTTSSCVFGPRAADVPSLLSATTTLRRAATPTTTTHRGVSALRATTLVGDPGIPTPASNRNAFAAQPLVHHHRGGASNAGGHGEGPTTTIYSAAAATNSGGGGGPVRAHEDEQQYQQQKYHLNRNSSYGNMGGAGSAPYTFAAHVELLRSGAKRDACDGSTRVDAFPAGHPLRRHIAEGNGGDGGATLSSSSTAPWDLSAIEARREDLSAMMLSDDVHTAVAVDGALLRIAKPRFSYIL